MNYEEKKFLDLLSGVDPSLHKIKQIVSYMMYYRDSSYEKILDAWVRQFHSVPAEIKILLIYTASDVIIQTNRRGKSEYVKGFGDLFIECFKDLVKSTENLEILNNLIKLCDMWESELIYAFNFMELIRKKIIKVRIDELTNNEDHSNALLDRSLTLQGELKLITKWDYCNHNFTLDIQEENIKAIYESLDKDKFNSLLSNPSDENSKKEINECEEKLKELRNLIITDLTKREKFILNLADFITLEKDEYFSHEDNKVKPKSSI